MLLINLFDFSSDGDRCRDDYNECLHRLKCGEVVVLIPCTGTRTEAEAEFKQVH
jgi:hypothetical protein